MTPHPLEKLLNADANDIMSAIQAGNRAIVDVKGKLAEYFLDKHLKRLKQDGIISSYLWSDKDGQPDFEVIYKERELKIECKNIRSKELFSNPRAYKVELQKTRNSKDGTNTRGYRVDEFNILAACLFNHTRKWEYYFSYTLDLERRSEERGFLKIMQPVPFEENQIWSTKLVDIMNRGIRKK